MTKSSKRAEYRARASLVWSIASFVGTLLIGLWSGIFAVFALSWVILAAVLVWFVLCLQFHQRALAEQEKLDVSQLGRDSRASKIFEAGGERATLLAVAQRRLDVFEKWFIPVFSAIIAVYQVGIGLYLLSKVSAGIDIEPKEPLVVALGMTAIAFVSFLLSRYVTGMSAEQQWRPLRAGGSFLLGIAGMCFALAVALALLHNFQVLVLLAIINWVIPILLVVVGAETALNVVLDIYRPRLKGQYSRAAFDSRLLGIINEPGGILRTAASAIDYQFGFEVSQTWFYKLLERAIVPLVLFAAVTLHLLSCIVVVAPEEQAIVEHFGNPLNQAGESRLLGPGLAFKWPWPIGIVYKYPAGRISQLNIGFVPKADSGRVGHGPLLWGKTHYEKEYKLLVASESQQGASGVVPVSLVMAAVPVQYRVKDLYAFLYNHDEPEKVLESICYRELTRFAASARVEVETESDRAHSLLGAGRAKAKEVLTRAIQKSADEANLGVEIVFLGLQGIHPPPEVAEAYQKVIGAVQEKQAAVLKAEAQRNETLTALAGSVAEAKRLYALAAEYQKAEEENNAENVRALGSKLDEAFAQARGEIFAILREAQSDAFEKATLARATGERFAGQLAAYRASKKIYRHEQRMTTLEDALKDTRKYVVVADANDQQVFIIDATEKLMPSLYDLSGFRESRKK
ncbi:MAG: protease modulator HflK [Planctomycetota bacterium]|jgi:regulator of protease activity HflC (stomatin/prohibitin superfamily)